MSHYPMLRDDLVTKRQVMAGEVTYLIKSRETLQYMRFGEVEWAIISRLDGNTSFAELAESFNRQFPEKAVTAGQVEDFVLTLKRKGIVVRTPAEQSLVILEKLHDERKKRAEHSQGRDVFYLTLATTNPEKFYKAIYPYLRWIWTPPFVVTTLAMFLTATLVIVSNWPLVRQGMARFWSFQGKTAADVVMIFAILAVIIAIHESAHALTCMNFGGEVNELGFMLIYFIPAFYANVSDAYLFDKKWHKYWVTLAGGYSELIICSLAVFTWLLASPDTFLYHLAYNVMVFAGISTIVFNYNPLIKLDGYYLLTDYLEVSNLRESSTAYLVYLIRKHVFRVAAEPPWGLTPRKQRIFLIYGILSTLYIIFIVSLFILFLFRYFTRNFAEIGLFLALFASYLILKKRIKKLMRFSQFVWLDKRDLLKEKASVRRWALGTAGFLLLLVLFPFSHSLSGEVTLEPERRAQLVAETSGFVAEVADPGAQAAPRLERGTLILRLRNDELVARRRKMHAEVERLSLDSQRNLAKGDLAAYQADLRALDRAQAELAELHRQEARLEIRAPFPGEILTARLRDLVGRRVEPGTLLCEFGDTQRMRARIRVSEFDFRELAEEQPVRLKVKSFPGETFTGRVAARSLASPDAYDAVGRASGLIRATLTTAANEGVPFSHFEVLAEIDNPEGRLRPGMTGLAKISPDRHNLVARAYRAVRDLFRSKVWW